MGYITSLETAGGKEGTSLDTSDCIGCYIRMLYVRILRLEQKQIIEGAPHIVHRNENLSIKGERRRAKETDPYRMYHDRDAQRSLLLEAQSSGTVFLHDRPPPALQLSALPTVPVPGRRFGRVVEFKSMHEGTRARTRRFGDC